MFLAADASHIVPPTGAKGLNLAMADIWKLTRAIQCFYDLRSQELLDRYSEHSLQRVGRAQQFSWWMTSLLHRPVAGNSFDVRRQHAELEYVTSSRAAMTSLTENYVGLPLRESVPEALTK